MFGRLGPTEILMILAAVLFIFGARKLPEIGKGLGEGFRNFRKGLKGEEPEQNSSPPTIQQGLDKDKEPTDAP